MSSLGLTYSFSNLAPESSQSLSQNSLENPEDGVRRVTIKQLLSAHVIGEDTFYIKQQPLGKFILLANVYRNYAISSKSKILYGFDDGTGRISGYKTDSEAGTGYPTFIPFTYATILGRLLKDSDGSVVVKVQYIWPLTDPHEIYFHLLHVIFDDLRYERGNPGKEDWLASQSHDHQIGGLVSALRDIDISNNHLSELEHDVVACIKDLKEYLESHDDVESLAHGIQIGSLVQELSRNHQDKEALDFADAIERLLALGLLRTTIDDNHLDFAYEN